MRTLFFILLPFPISIFGEIGEGNISVSDLIIAALLFTMLGRGKWRLGGVGQAGIVFLLAATCSSLLSTSPEHVALGLGRMALVTIGPLLLFANADDPIRELRRGLTAYCISGVALACCSIFVFARGGIEASISTLGINKNAQGPIFGSAVVIVLAGLMTNTVARGRKRLIAYITLAFNSVGLLLCLSRGGWVGTGAGILVVLGFTRRVKAALLAGLMLVPLLAAVWSLLPEDRVEYATDISPNSYVMRARFDAMAVAMDAFWSNPALGVGVGLRRTVEPHNVIVLTLGETGLAGLATFCLMVGAGVMTLLAALRRLQQAAPERAVMLAALAAFAVYHIQTMIDVYWRRGVGALSWACVGVAVAVIQTGVVRSGVQNRKQSEPLIRARRPRGAPFRPRLFPSRGSS
jgi:uncharacterized membrane protein YphA (DoxX/SURF4 family)